MTCRRAQVFKTSRAVETPPNAGLLDAEPTRRRHGAGETLETKTSSRLRKNAALRGAQSPSGVAGGQQPPVRRRLSPRGEHLRPVSGPLPYGRAGSASRVRRRTRL